VLQYPVLFITAWSLIVGRHEDRYLASKSQLWYRIMTNYLTCRSMLCHVTFRYVVSCYVMLCYVMLCYVMLCYVMLCYVMTKNVFLETC
jgi:hypothetical protein